LSSILRCTRHHRKILILNAAQKSKTKNQKASRDATNPEAQAKENAPQALPGLEVQGNIHLRWKKPERELKIVE
jgi:hypothetical protein